MCLCVCSFVNKFFNMCVCVHALLSTNSIRYSNVNAELISCMLLLHTVHIIYIHVHSLEFLIVGKISLEFLPYLCVSISLFSLLR
jgi:hypothetical protein